MSSETRETKPVSSSSLDRELYRQAKMLGLNVSGVSERALRVYLERLDNGSGQGGTIFASNDDAEPTGGDEPAATTDDVDEDGAEYANASTDEILGKYHQFATSVLDYSENPVQLYTRYTRRLLEHVDKPPSQVTRDDITDYLDSGGDVSDATRMNIIGALRVFFRDFLDREVMGAFEMPSKSAKPTDVPSKDDLQTFYEMLENPKYKGAFPFPATSGLRSSELCQLTMDDIDEEKRMIVPDKESSTKETWLTFYNDEAAEAFESFKPEQKSGDERVF